MKIKELIEQEKKEILKEKTEINDDEANARKYRKLTVLRNDLLMAVDGIDDAQEKMVIEWHEDSDPSIEQIELFEESMRDLMNEKIS